MSEAIDEAAMRLAIDQARNAWLVGEVPVGAVIMRDTPGGRQLVATGYNRPITEHDPTAHAEIVALRHAATLLAEGQDVLVALRMAKVEAGDTFAFAGDRAVQFHGGFGFTFECDAQLFLRRALWLQYSFGDAAHHRRRLADALLGAAAA